MKTEKSDIQISRFRLWVLLLITIMAFSSIETIVNPIRHRIDPFALTFWRFLLGAICLLPLTFRSGNRERLPVHARDWGIITVLGILNVVVAMGAHAVSITHSRASTAALLIASNPLTTNILAWFILGETLTRRRLLALGIGLPGVALVAMKAAPGVDTLLGITAGIIGMCGFSLYTVLSKSTVRAFGSPNVATFGFLAGAIADLPVLLIMGVPIIPEADLWPRLIFLGVVVSGIGYMTFFEALKELPAGQTSLLFFVKPPVALLLAWFFLGEIPSWSALVGGGLIMGGILLDRITPAAKMPHVRG
ncbi:MAG: EamA family transporter [Candidatus Ozemobacteraceae bacterium]